MRVYQLGKVRKLITTDTECTTYKQTILPVLDCGDFMTESALKTRYDRLEKLQ